VGIWPPDKYPHPYLPSDNTLWVRVEGSRIRRGNRQCLFSDPTRSRKTRRFAATARSTLSV
jgi:hypothetical protein